MGSQTKPTDYSYCTFFDIGYLSRGIALIESLRQQGDSSQVMVLCLDHKTRDSLAPLAQSLNLAVVALHELIAEYPELEPAKLNRSQVEFYFTCSPFVVKLSQKDKPIGHLSIYLDADLYFFGDPKEVLDEMSESSVAIVEHNYPWFLKHLSKKYGDFNVGLLGFRNNEDGNKTLDWWAKECINWCHDYPQDGKYADQGYLNSFPEFTPNLKVLKNRGFNSAPWNTAATSLQLKNDKVFVGKNPLNFFHFHGLKKRGSFWVSSQLNYLSPLPKGIFMKIYGPYVRHLEAIEQNIPISEDPPNSLERKSPGLRGLMAKAARGIFTGLSLVSGQCLAAGQKRIRK